MEVAARSYLLAGVALVGAGAIAVAPIQPLPADIAVPAVPSVTTPVELNALVNPLQLWTEVIATTIGNVGGLTDTVLANPAPIAGSIVNNQLITAQVLASFVTNFGSGFVTGVGNVPDALQSAFDQILNGDIASGVPAIATAFLTPVLLGAFGALGQLPDVTAVLQNPFLNASAAIGEVLSFNTLIGLGIPALLSVVAPVAQIGLTGQKIYDGIQADDFEAVANALISFPSDMVNTIVNGNPELSTGGLLGSASDGGLIAGLLKVRQAIADALKPPDVTTTLSLKTVADAPELAAESFTVTVDSPAAVERGTTAAGALADGDENDGGVVGSASGSAASALGVEGAAAEDVAAEDATTDQTTAGAEDAALVRDSAKAVPGKVGTTVKTRQARTEAAVKSLGDNVEKSVKKLGDNVKKLGDNVKNALGGKKKASSDSGADAGSGAE